MTTQSTGLGPPGQRQRPQKRRGREAAERRASAGSLTELEQKRVDYAVAVCADIGLDGWETPVASRLADCLTDDTWNRLFGVRRQGDCKVLANMAKALLDGKKRRHELVGTGASWAVRLLQADRLERRVVKELAERIPFQS